MIGATLIVVLLVASVLAHPGGLDSNGGHTNRKTGEYHYHRAPSTSKPSEPTKKQSSQQKQPVNSRNLQAELEQTKKKVDTLISLLQQKGVLTEADLQSILTATN